MTNSTNGPVFREGSWTGSGTNTVINTLLLQQAELRVALEKTRSNVLRVLAVARTLREAPRPVPTTAGPLPEIARRVTDLSPRQRAVFERVVRRELNKAIAFDLGVSSKTVETHRARVMKRLGARTLADLVRIAERIDHRATTVE